MEDRLENPQNDISDTVSSQDALSPNRYNLRLSNDARDGRASFLVVPRYVYIAGVHAREYAHFFSARIYADTRATVYKRGARSLNFIRNYQVRRFDISRE